MSIDLAELSHNLQTPLAILKARVAKLRTGMVHEGELNVGFRGIDDCIDTLSRAIAELLSVTAQPNVPRQPHHELSLSALLAETAEEAAVISDMNGISLTASIEAGVAVVGNIRELRETFMNLLANAVKYMGNGIRKEISLGLSADLSRYEAVATITDTGIGISEADLPYIFNRFYRSTQVYGVAPGMGLGLASVARVVREHGGRIEVASFVGEGTTFTLTLPMRLGNAPLPVPKTR